MHGFPNYFFISGPDNANAAVQLRYVAEALDLMNRTASTRIEVLRSTQQVFNERAQLKPVHAQRVSRAFDLSADAPDDDTYDGAATLELAGTRLPVHVRLAGHLDPIDGNYHWQGTVFDPLPPDSLTQSRTATLTVGDRSAPARIVEQTPWGTHSVAGVGAPPYPPSGR
ncbi:putative monooxygenase [Mycobacterium kansasii]|uniref:Putative monooxygenase n=1 Tax=Mycobacterium kansasii TaxID=1768 RepID=A0A1V3XJ08_MYCKA|nr:putative monooxygenase [Mycobacterium kansasii]